MAFHSKNEYYGIAFTVVNHVDGYVDEVWTNVLAKWCHDKADAEEEGRKAAKAAFPSSQYSVHAIAVTRIK